ncbi:MAG: M1 family metallopeptidase, partial [bacterium]
MPAASEMRKNAKNVRLPLHVLPERYEISISTDLKKSAFEGSEVILIHVAKPVKSIVLHSKNLELSGVVLVHGRKRLKPEKITFDKNLETATFWFKENIKKGRATLEISFSGILNDELRGFYRSKYIRNGKDVFLATTQFEPTDARRAFPCFDEPDKKAVFKIYVFAPTGTMAISNTLPEKVKKETRGSWYHFAPTPKMSSYLVAFVVGEFEYMEEETEEGVVMKIYSTPGKQRELKFAMDAAIKSLSFYNNYFGIPYPLPALQFIAIPDFQSAAMENWGAITYRESALLINEHASVADKEWVALVTAHEIAHQWFGNLVTMEWWTDLWLNEGFATYMEYVAVNKIFPEWDIRTRFTGYGGHGLSYALRLDGLENTHPIEIPVHNPNEINEIFDGVSYAKGANIIRMLAAYLGEDRFKKGLRNYLHAYRYGNARTRDLWKSLESASREPVLKMMSTWTERAGYPLLEIEENKNNIKISQRRFFGSASANRNSKDKTLWHIPLGIEPAKAGFKTPRLMTRKSVILPKIQPGTKFNFGECGFFRTKYPPSWLGLLGKYIEEKKLSAPDRLGVIRDSYALAEAGIVPITQALRLTAKYHNELDYTVWSLISGNIRQMSSLLYGTPHYDAYENYARSVFVELVRKMGWDKKKDESHNDALLRMLALANFGGYGDKETIRTAEERFKAQREQLETVDPDLRGVVYGLAAKYGGKKDFDWFIKTYKNAVSAQEKERIGVALGAFKDESILIGSLEFTMSNNVRLQDGPAIFAGVGMNPHGRNLYWEFIQKHWATFLHRYPDGSHLLTALIKPLGGFADKTRAKEVEKFFSTHEAPGAERTIKQAIERIRSNADWLNRDQ